MYDTIAETVPVQHLPNPPPDADTSNSGHWCSSAHYRRASHGATVRARVALARKLAVVLHAIWRSGEPFRWTAEPRVA